MFAISHARPCALSVAVVVLGCVTPSARRTYEYDEARRIDEITLAEIKTVQLRASTAADVVRLLRPSMFEARRPSVAYSASGSTIQRAGTVQVYVDNIPYGGLETLTTIPAASVRSVRRLSPMDAVTRFGGSHPDGVIVVTTGVPDQATR
jgi:YD repeat-containing protein